MNVECRIFPRVLKEKKWPKKNGKIDLVEVYEIIKKELQESAPILVALYQLAITAEFTEARVECVFLWLMWIDSTQRRSMGASRELNPAYLTFENGFLVKDITFYLFMKLWTCKP